MQPGHLHKLEAFTNRPDGGNPAGVWIGETFPDENKMQRIAAEVGFSETAFVIPAIGQHRDVRYFSPEIEVPFCGHATIAAGVLLGETERDGTYILNTSVAKVKQWDVLVGSLCKSPPVAGLSCPAQRLGFERFEGGSDRPPMKTFQHWAFGALKALRSNSCVDPARIAIMGSIAKDHGRDLAHLQKTRPRSFNGTKKLPMTAASETLFFLIRLSAWNRSIRNNNWALALFLGL